jgi:hypothetical protein
MPGSNAKNPRENCSFSIDIGLLPLLREYCTKHDRNQSDAVNKAIKLLLAVDAASDAAFWEQRYTETEE